MHSFFDDITDFARWLYAPYTKRIYIFIRFDSMEMFTSNICRSPVEFDSNNKNLFFSTTSVQLKYENKLGVVRGNRVY